MASRLALLLALLLSGACAPSGSGGPDDGGRDDAGTRDGGDVAADTDAPDAGDLEAWREQRLRAYCGEDNAAAVEARIDATLPELTLPQKASLMHGYTLLPADGTWNTAAIEEFGIPGFRMLDGPRGLSELSEVPGTAFPVGMARGATWSPELEARVGAAIGGELRVVGANVLLAPTVNVLRHPRWGRAQETYGEDPHLLGRLGAAFVTGAQEHVLAVVKHYAANSIENTRLEVDVQVPEAELREIYLPHFEHIVTAANVGGVMTAYNRVNGDWASESDHLVREILRDEWGFMGFTVSDFFWGTHNTVPAFEAGLDVEMQIPQIYGDALMDAVEDGEITEAALDETIRRILRAQWCFEESTVAPAFSVTENDANLDLAEEVAQRAMVLLKNEDDLLPMTRDPGTTIALVGDLASSPNTGDRGSSHVESTDVVTIREGLIAAAGDATVDVVEGDLADEALADRIRDADAVVAVVGYTEVEEGEGQIAAGDRVSMALPEDDVALLQRVTALSSRVVAVVVAGSAITMDGWHDEAESIVMAWYAGARGGDAAASLLFGDANFSGRLPITFARSDDDLPAFDNTSLTVSYAGLHGYQYALEGQTEPLYPFGFGRSYTTFEWSLEEVTADDEALRARVRVSNTGARAGVETVQLYVAPPNGAPHALRAFAQREVMPGASEEIDLVVPLRDLRVWTPSGWALLEGDYTVYAAPDAHAAGSEVSLRLPGAP